jgi:hypothetical protein
MTMYSDEVTKFRVLNALRKVHRLCNRINTILRLVTGTGGHLPECWFSSNSTVFSSNRCR